VLVKKIVFILCFLFSINASAEDAIGKMMRVHSGCENLKSGLYQNINSNVANRNLWFAGIEWGFLEAVAEKLQDEDKFCKPRGIDTLALANLIHNRLQEEQAYGDIKRCSAISFIEKVLIETYPCK
jgi:hypothetical protein